MEAWYISGTERSLWMGGERAGQEVADIREVQEDPRACLTLPDKEGCGLYSLCALNMIFLKLLQEEGQVQSFFELNCESNVLGVPAAISFMFYVRSDLNGQRV